MASYNRSMRWTAVLAGACIPAPWAAQWNAALRPTALPSHLARGTLEHADDAAGPQAAQRWLWQQLGGAGEPVRAPYVYTALGGSALPSLWLCEPVHYAAGLDDITVLPLDAPLSQSEAAALLDAAVPALEACGASLIDRQGRWFLQPDRPWQIEAAPLEAALGGSLRRHWPSGPDAPRWRRLLTEIQMRWHEHPVNLMRERRGARSVNGLWLHGGGAWRPLPTLPWPAVLTDDPLVSGWMQAAGAAATAGRPADGPLPPQPALFFDASLAQCCAPDDAAHWLDRWRLLAARIETFRRHALAQGAADVELVFSGRNALRRLRLRRTDALRFWRRRESQDLLLEADA